MRLKPMVSSIIFLRFIRFKVNLPTAEAGGLSGFLHGLSKSVVYRNINSHFIYTPVDLLQVGAELFLLPPPRLVFLSGIRQLRCARVL